MSEYSGMKKEDFEPLMESYREDKKLNNSKGEGGETVKTPVANTPPMNPTPTKPMNFKYKIIKMIKK